MWNKNFRFLENILYKYFRSSFIWIKWSTLSLLSATCYNVHSENSQSLNKRRVFTIFRYFWHQPVQSAESAFIAEDFTSKIKNYIESTFQLNLDNQITINYATQYTKFCFVKVKVIIHTQTSWFKANFEEDKSLAYIKYIRLT